MLNSELADTLGNLLSRTCAPALNPMQVFPKFYQEALFMLKESHVQNLIQDVSLLPSKFYKCSSG